MRGWSINLFRIRGIQISLNFSFLLLLAYYCNEGYKEGGMEGLYWSGGTVLTFFVCVVLHELGHSFTGMAFGIKVRRITLSLIGGVAEFESIPRSPRQELLITVAGPSVNFAIAAILWCVLTAANGRAPFVEGQWGEFLATLLTWNIWVGLFNMIPAYPMDGGRIVRSLLAMRLPYLKATYTAQMISMVVTAIGVPVALFLHFNVMAVIFVYIFIAARNEYRALKRRESEEAQWRESLLQRVSPPPAPVPPIL
jgi:Zn-dependent protease